MSWYTTGSVAVTNNSATVTGTGTQWVANVRRGDMFVGPDGEPSEIIAIPSDTQLTLGAGYAGGAASGAAYRIVPTTSHDKELVKGITDLLSEIGRAPFATRAELVAWAATNTPAIGYEVRVAGLAYRYAGGSTAIADLPGWVPSGEVTAQHFGFSPTATASANRTAAQAAMNYSAHVVFMSGEYDMDGKLDGRIKHVLESRGCRINMTAPAATSTDIIGFSITDNPDGSDRYKAGAIRGFEFVRKTNTGGNLLHVVGNFSKQQKFTFDNNVIRGDSASSASPFYFHHAGIFEEIRTARAEGNKINGNIDTTLDPAGQVVTTGFASRGNCGDHFYHNNDIFTVYRGYRFGDGVEGWRVKAGNIVNCVNAINGAVTLGDPGGWAEDLHTNTIGTAMIMTKRSATHIAQCEIFRADGYFPISEWIGIDLDGVTRSNIGNIVFQPQAISGSPATCFRLKDTQMVNVSGLYMTGTDGIKSRGGNSGVNFDNLTFHGLTGTSYALDNSDTSMVLGQHVFVAMSNGYGNLTTSVSNIVRSRIDRYGSVSTTETVLNSSGTTALVPFSTPGVMRYNAAAGSGAWSHNIDLRVDSGTKRGDGMEFVVRCDATTNPAVRFRNGSGGPLMIAVTNPGGTAQSIGLRFAFNGTDWVCTQAAKITGTL